MNVDIDSIYMIKQDLGGLVYPLTNSDYSIRTYQAGTTDPRSWARIEVACNELPDMRTALDKFGRWTGQNEKILEDRCFFLIHKDEFEPVGTVTAWIGEVNQRPMGRLHWLAIAPEHQGKGLARPLVSAALHRLSQGSKSAYLKTQTRNKAAILLYFSLGFTPLIRHAGERGLWNDISRELGIDIPGIVESHPFSR